MSTVQQTIWARSQHTGQQVRCFQLENQQNIPWTQDVQRQADDFARRLNEQFYLQTSDWIGEVRTEDLGIHTFINAMNNR